MEFPMWISLGFAEVHPHLIFELLAYSAGITTMVLQKRVKSDVIEAEQRAWIAFAGLLGALFGAVFIASLEHPGSFDINLSGTPFLIIGGKTVVGGLVGGMLAIEGLKKALGITTRTGDAFVLPLAVGMSIGRLGCFFTGLPDATYGIETSLFWGVDFGDGISRHPTQLYEILFIWALAAWILRKDGEGGQANGWMFRTYMVGYLWWRLSVDFIKPSDYEVIGMTAIQWTCILALVWYHTKGRITPLPGHFSEEE